MSQAYGKEKSDNVYFKVGNGAITQDYPKPEGWDGVCDFAQGVFTKFNYYYDEGNPSKNVSPGMRLDIFLVDQDGDGTKTLVLRAKSPNTFSRMVASHLPNIKAGDMVKLRVWAGTDNQKVTVCMIDRLDPDTGAWVKVPRIELPKSGPPKADGKTDTTAKDAETDRIFRSHPALRDKTAREETPVDNGVTSLKDDPEFDPFADEGEE